MNIIAGAIVYFGVFFKKNIAKENNNVKDQYNNKILVRFFLYAVLFLVIANHDGMHFSGQGGWVPIDIYG
jgi:hypothetical protein